MKRLFLLKLEGNSMHPYSLERTLKLPINLETAWDFFTNPENLTKITPPDMDFHITSPKTSHTWAGQIVTYTVRPLFGIRVNWTTEITHLQKPYFFVDEQRFGPYRFWHHQHTFKAVDDGVEIHDLVHYLLHQENLASFINRFIVEPRLKRIFDFRTTALQNLFQ